MLKIVCQLLAAHLLFLPLMACVAQPLPVPVSAPPSGSPVAATGPCDGASAVPFTSLGSAGQVFMAPSRISCLPETGPSFSEPGVPIASLDLADGRRIVFVREAVNSFLGIHIQNQQTGWSQIPLDYTQRSKLHFEHAFVHDERAFFLVYNVGLSIPSGRRLQGLSEGLDLFEIKLDAESARLEQIPEASWSAGLEAAVFHVSLNNRTVICAALDCQEMRVSNGDVELTDIDMPLPKETSHRIVELSGEGDQAFLLLQREYDDRLHGLPSKDVPVFELCAITHTLTCAALEASGTPWNLTVENGKASLKFAQSGEDYAALLAFDLNRLRQTGVANLMENNIEGRIAWSAVYYLNGLATIAGDESGLGTPFSGIAEQARLRLGIEIGFWGDALDLDYPGFQAKRYSIDREPLLSVLHIARIVRVLQRAALLADVHLDQARRDKLLEFMRPGDETLEYVSSVPGGRTELRLRKYAAFWADGTNAPWNYQSGWIDGLAALNDEGLNQDYGEAVRAMLAQFIADESLLSFPDDWKYASGDTFNGWDASSGISSNTPSWAGDRMNTQVAHVSYRTMDVMALLSADRVGLSKIPPDVKSHLFSLIDQGRVWPFAMEEAHRHGYSLGMDRHTAKLFARTVHPYDLQSQVWVIPVLIEDND